MSVEQKIAEALAEDNKALRAQVERYQKLVCQTCDGHGMVGNILDSMDCPDCTALGNQEQEEIKALKAQTIMVIAELERVDKMVSIAPVLYPTLIDIRHRIEALRKVTPRQCLADVRANAVELFMEKLIIDDKSSSILWCQGYGISYVQQLRDNAK